MTEKKTNETNLLALNELCLKINCLEEITKCCWLIFRLKTTNIITKMSETKRGQAQMINGTQQKYEKFSGTAVN